MRNITEKTEKTERAKQMLAEIFMVTSGVFVIETDNQDWAHEYLFEIFEIISDDPYPMDLLSELQATIYKESYASFRAEMTWKDRILERCKETVSTKGVKQSA